ncbi:MAG: DUF1289 domain-containing protein [Bacteroidota bacterium]
MLPSPCINLCQMEAANGLCRGCFRTLDEITRWARTDDAERAVILAAVTRRRREGDLPTAPAA